ncbi:hypothetical protein MBLNU230_g1640t1 [Neophaeotheca triangularis]
MPNMRGMGQSQTSSGAPASSARPFKTFAPSSRPGASGVGGKGLGLGKSKTAKRHRKILRDNIQGVTRGDIRRMARRGGVKRISGMIYGDIRQALKERLELLLKDICAVVESANRKTVCTTDVIFTLRRLGNPIYGFGDANDKKR